MNIVRKTAMAAAAIGAVLSVAPAHAATLIADGITYSLTETVLTATVAQFTLGITGINGPSDTEGGRFGVNALAFNPPTNFASATAPSGFTNMAGGLDSSGCNGSGNFFCFKANTKPTGPALAANSSLSFVFDVTRSSGNWSTYSYVPDFKVEWLGTKSKRGKSGYDLVSQPLAATEAVPEPAAWSMMLLGLAGLGGVARANRRALAKISA